MYCAKCGKEIPDGEKKVCDECEKSVVEAIVAEEKAEVKAEAKTEKKKEKKSKKEKNGVWEVSKKKEKKGLIKKVIVCALTVLCVALVIFFISKLFTGSNVGNTIGNIRNYGYATESNGWIYYLSPNEDSTEIGIFKIKNNGKDKQQLYMSGSDIVSMNVYKGYIYFIGSATETYLEEDELDNKIYRMKTDGTGLEVLNDNELNNDCYEIYVVNDEIYYIGLNAEICKMDLNGSNKTIVADNGTGYLGVTDKYIIYNSMASETDIEYVTYIMNLDGTDAKPIIEGKRLYSVNIEGNYIYYSDSNKKLYRTEIGSNVEETLYDNIETYNLNTNDGYAYYLNYLDAENGDYTVCLFRVKLDGSTQTPEKLKEMESYSSFIDVVGDWVIYMDSSDEAGFINLVNKNGKGDEIELYRLDYSAFNDMLDFSDEQVDASGEEVEDEEVVEEEIEDTNSVEEEKTNETESNTVTNTTNVAENKVSNETVENKVENEVANTTVEENKTAN